MSGTLHKIISDSYRFSKRDFSLNYKNTFLGYAWIVVNPVLMVILYVAVFGYIFGGSFDGNNDKVEYGLGIFIGLTLFSFVAESLGSAPNLIITKRNLVEKVKFPLEILPVTSWFTGSYKCIISLALATTISCLHTGNLHLELVWLPLLLVPLFILSGAITFFFSTFGVYFRDISNLSNLLSRGLFFASAIFFPIEAVPEDYRIVLYLNPVAVIIDQIRTVVLWGGTPDIKILLFTYLGVMFFFVISVYMFRKFKEAFADVL